MPLVNVGAQLRDSIVFWAIEQQPGVFKFEIPHDAVHITGDRWTRPATERRWSRVRRR
jgi:hypothetical protein